MKDRGKVMPNSRKREAAILSRRSKMKERSKVKSNSKKRKAAKARKLGLSNTLQKDGIIQTNATKTLGLTSAPEVVTFVDHKKRNKSKQEGATGISNADERGSVANRKEITMKEARFQVFKFGVSGMDKKSKEEANTALAVRLGAKPEKNKFLDYKDLKEERKLEKEEKEIRCFIRGKRLPYNK